MSRSYEPGVSRVPVSDAAPDADEPREVIIHTIPRPGR